MKGLFVIMSLAGFSASIRADDFVDVEFTRGTERTRIRIVLPVETPDPAVAFLDKYFDFLDRNGDGQLSPAELKNLFPLPNPGQREIRPEFGQLGSPMSNPVSKEEFRKAYRDVGFQSTATIATRAVADVNETNGVLVRALDRDGDGRLTRAELQAAPKLIRQFDDDDDEAISVAELRSILNQPSAPLADFPLPVFSSSANQPTAVVRLSRKSASSSADRRNVVSILSGECVFEDIEEDREFFRETRSFYQSQFKAAAGSKPGITKNRIEQDPTLQGLIGVFEIADRDGDGTLTLAELNALLDLVTEGARCRTMISITDRGCDWFGRLDADRNGKLDERELVGAAAFALRTKQDSIAIVDLPRQYTVVSVRGPVGRSFGPITLATRKPVLLTPIVEPAKGPAWFRSMDRNGDGVVSIHEFLGTPERFRAFDVNGDGRISVAEAELVDRP